MQKTKTNVQKVSPLSVRLPREDRALLEAAAYKWGMVENLIESTTEANLSEFVRRIIHDYLEGFSEMNGGREAVLKEFLAARRVETEDLLRMLTEGSSNASK